MVLDTFTDPALDYGEDGLEFEKDKLHAAISGVYVSPDLEGLTPKELGAKLIECVDRAPRPSPPRLVARTFGH